jgi:heme/copper-type cytochrome/quinol oxidase subunit 4
MTNGREVGSYIAAHIMGFVLGALLTTFVMVPIYTSTGVATHAVSRYMVSFLFFAVVQVVVFGVFIVLRGRSG